MEVLPKLRQSKRRIDFGRGDIGSKNLGPKVSKEKRVSPSPKRDTPKTVVKKRSSRWAKAKSRFSELSNAAKFVTPLYQDARAQSLQYVLKNKGVKNVSKKVPLVGDVLPTIMEGGVDMIEADRKRAPKWVQDIPDVDIASEIAGINDALDWVTGGGVEAITTPSDPGEKLVPQNLMKAFDETEETRPTKKRKAVTDEKPKKKIKKEKPKKQTTKAVTGKRKKSPYKNIPTKYNKKAKATPSKKRKAEDEPSSKKRRKGFDRRRR